MNTLQILTDAGARAVAEHADRLARRLDGLGGRLADAVAQAVGEAVAGAVESAVRAALGDLAAGGPTDGRYGRSADEDRGYWGDEGDGWGVPGGRYEPTWAPGSRDRTATDAPDATRRRWLHVALLAGQLAARWLDSGRRHPRWLAAAAAGLVAALGSAAGGPAGGASSLSFLAGLLRSGSGLLSDLC
jgi:hypothetical protein